MDIKEAVGSVLKDLIVPELDKIKEENKEIKATLVLTNKRLDDINLHRNSSALSDKIVMAYRRGAENAE